MIVVKIKEYTHVMKLEFQTVEEADKVLESGLLLFKMYVAAEQVTSVEFYSVQTCFKCYHYEDHSSKDCQKPSTKCSECVEEGHR